MAIVNACGRSTLVVPICLLAAILVSSGAMADTHASIREFCSLRWPEGAERQSGCVMRQSEAARKLFDLLEDVASGSEKYVQGQSCIEKSRLEKKKRKKLQKGSVDWALALKCIELRLENSIGP